MARSTRSPGSTRITRQFSGASWRNWLRVRSFIRAIKEPASSQPLGPPPTTTADCNTLRLS